MKYFYEKNNFRGFLFLVLHNNFKIIKKYLHYMNQLHKQKYNICRQYTFVKVFNDKKIFTLGESTTQTKTSTVSTDSTQSSITTMKTGHYIFCFYPRLFKSTS